MPTRPLEPAEGAFLIARGFFKKLVLADSIAVAIDPFFANVSDPSTAGVWALPYIYLYALQIYFDFSGYTDIARGLGLWFGFRWPENFNWPYLATSVQDFWRRWHMTLSRFLRDYLYIPLGGSRGGPLRVAAALMVTMLLGGLWHGASWSFMLWGGLHGAVPHHQSVVGHDRAARPSRGTHRRAGHRVVLVPHRPDVQRRLPGVVLLPADASAGQPRLRRANGSRSIGTRRSPAAAPIRRCGRSWRHMASQRLRALP